MENLTDELLNTKIEYFDKKETFQIAVKVKEWLKNKSAYAVASNQLGINHRFFVAGRKYKKVGLPTDLFLNPSYQAIYESEKIVCREQCLSYPDKVFYIERYTDILLNYYDPYSKTDESIKLSGLASIICQHEVGHLNGESDEDLTIDLDMVDKNNLYIPTAKKLIKYSEGV